MAKINRIAHIALNSFLNRITSSWLVIALLLAVVSVLAYCTSASKSIADNDKSPWLNHNDTVKYVGINTCKQCHMDIYTSFMQTGMGQSLDKATKSKSAGDFSKAHTVYDAELNLYYSPFWLNDSLHVKEFRLSGKDTIHQRTEKITYIVGSGHHTNSHFWQSNGYVYQAPFTFYTQKKIWDLPPGFEKGASSRFQRLIGLECMSCHNGYPQFVKGSENKYISLPQGIDCERCHGPGSLHVAEKQKGILIDTSKYVDYTIVNPGKLSVDLQFDLCQRCHLQGNAVLKEGKSWYDFKPGQKLSETMLVFLPKYKGAEQEFIMASHADRLKQSACFIKSAEKADNSALRPYKNALTCVSCHNPHVSVRNQGSEPFIKKCQSCHDGSSAEKNRCSETEQARSIEKNNCITCHMPLSGSIDIPHVSIHDHYIRKQPKMNNVLNKSFLGLYCVNDTKVSHLEQAKAYMNQFEKFEPGKTNLLDSAARYLAKDLELTSKNTAAAMIHLLYLRSDWNGILSKVNEWTEKKLLQQWFTETSFTNADAWACYRIGEAFYQNGNYQKAFEFYKATCLLAPYYPDFKNKKGTTLLLLGQLNEAYQLFEELSKENPEFAPAWNNLGICQINLQDYTSAEKSFLKALHLDPDYEQATNNLIKVYETTNQTEKAKKYRKLIAQKQKSA